MFRRAQLEERLYQGDEFVVIGAEGSDAAVALVGKFRQSSIKIFLHHGILVLEALNFGLKAIQIVLGLLIRFGGSLDLVQEFGFVLLEILVEESHVTSSARIDIVGQDWIRTKLAKSVEVQLASKTGKIGVLKVQGQDGLNNRKGTKKT